MPFSITTREAHAGSVSGTVYTLVSETARCAVWPFLGFNCLKWQIKSAIGWGDLLYAAPDWETNPIPTRSGHPVLFPFPNRMNSGSFHFRGKTWQLPKNESTGLHAIHGFTPRNPWRVVETVAADDYARITGEFRISREVPQAVWPGDLSLRLSYQLEANTLHVKASITNCDRVPVPCGLGYHPYFCHPWEPNVSADTFVLRSPGKTLWEANNGIPTGVRSTIPSEIDFRQGRSVGSVELDRLYTDFEHSPGELLEMAELAHETSPGRLTVSVSSAFRELLLFTPPHRKALAIEPYTCASDAANLEARGADAGWVVLPPDAVWNSHVQYRWHAT